MFDSVRVRLTLWYTAVLALVLVSLSAGTYWLVERATARRTDVSLTEISEGFLTTLESEYKDQVNARAADPLRAAAQEAVEEFRLRDHRFAVLDAQGNVLAQNHNLPARDREPAALSPIPEIAPRILRDLAARVPSPSGTRSRGSQDVLIGAEHVRVRITRAAVGGSPLVVLALESRERERELLEDIRATLLWVIPLALLVASAGGYFLARKSLAPVVAMSEKATRIGARNLHERLPLPNARDELGYLASSFNGLLERLDRSFEQQRRFMADASHELRSPVAVIRGEAEVALSQPRAAGEYRESLAIALDEARRLSRIVDDLFTLARADAGQYPLRPRDFYLEELAADCVRAARSMAAARGITLSYEPDGEMPIHADETLIRRLAMNLLDNAIKYTPPGGRVSISCSRNHGEYALAVRDSGPGIPSEVREKIFERFFRLDPARTPSARAASNGSKGDGAASGEEKPSSETAAASGAGLGLAIARWIAEAHHGRLVLVHSDSTGSTFTAFLPSSGAGAAPEISSGQFQAPR